jgi:SAM-dependent MidA family methyltransferase
MAERLSAAMARALYGQNGFFRRERPADHFRTSVTASPLFAEAIARLVAETDRALNHPDVLTVVDVGAGRGRLLSQLLELLGHDERLRPIAIELADRPDGLDERIEWRPDIPAGFTGVLVATEWLDNVPLDVAELDADGTARYLLSDGTLGDRLDDADARWVDEWWPLRRPGDAAEIGRSRDVAWAAAVAGLNAGLALAVDYGHTRADRRSTLTGFRDGHEVEPRFDGTTDITAHVAIDSVARAGRQGRGPQVRTPAADSGGLPSQAAQFGVPVKRQREALRALGIDGARPPLSLAAADPAGYVRALSRASQAAELIAEGGLGDHWWVLQPVAIEWEAWRLSQSWTR